MTEFPPEQALTDAQNYAADRSAGNVQSLYVAQFDAAARAIDVSGHDMNKDQTLDMTTQEPVQTAETNVNADVVRSAIPVLGQ